VDPAFSSDSAWVSYMVNLPRKEADKLRKARKPVPRAAELSTSHRARSSRSRTRPASASDGSRVPAIKRESRPRGEARRRRSVVRTLATGATQNIGNVSDYQFNKAGTRLRTRSMRLTMWEMAFAMDLERQTLSTLDTGATDYAQLA
jgi:hypothetical protein